MSAGARLGTHGRVARSARDSPAVGAGLGFQPMPVTQWRSSVQERDGVGGRRFVFFARAAGIRGATRWTRARWALYADGDGGRVCPSRGHFFTLINLLWDNLR